MSPIKTFTFAALAAIAVLLPVSAYPEEGGVGHYAPGAMASFIDVLPGKPGLAVFNYSTYYSGNANASRQLPIAGQLTAGVDATSYVDTVGAFYESPLKLLGADYAVGIAIPYVWTEVKGNAQLGNTTRRVRDTASGVGDITLYPFMLAWNALDGELKYDLLLSIYAPTGDFDKNKLANPGLGYWTFEPGVIVSYLSSKTGLELTAYAALDFNTENNDTDYQSGDVFHVDATIAEHLPLGKGFIGVGANAFYYKQFTGDSGSGASRGSFKMETAGVGPVLSYATQFGQTQVVAELKWLPQLSTTNTLEGDYVWFKLALLF